MKDNAGAVRRHAIDTPYAWQMIPLHDLFHRERRRDVERHARVVPFSMARCAFDDRIVVRDARLLRRLRQLSILKLLGQAFGVLWSVQAAKETTLYSCYCGKLPQGDF